MDVEMMLTWVMYDIPDDATRNKVASLCLDYGLRRLQKSVFCGDQGTKNMLQLADRINDVVKGRDEGARILFMAACERCVSGIISIGTPFSPEDFRYPRLVIIG